MYFIRTLIKCSVCGLESLMGVCTLATINGLKDQRKSAVSGYNYNFYNNLL